MINSFIFSDFLTSKDKLIYLLLSKWQTLNIGGSMIYSHFYWFANIFFHPLNVYCRAAAIKKVVFCFKKSNFPSEASNNLKCLQSLAQT